MKTEEANNFKEFIEQNFYSSDGHPQWSWIEGYNCKLSTKFKLKIIKILLDKEKNES